MVHLEAVDFDYATELERKMQALKHMFLLFFHFIHHVCLRRKIKEIGSTK